MKNLIVILSLLFCFQLSFAQIVFEEDTLSPFLTSARSGTMALGDIDNDGDLDLFVSGNDLSNRVTTMYKNDGNGVFSAMSNTNFATLEFGHAAFADIDQDGDQDLLFLGRFSSFSRTHLYLNDGTGNFTEDVSNSITQTKWGDFEFFDADNDNDLDFIISGNSTTSANILNPINHTTLYINNGSGSLTAATNTPFEALELSSIAVIDIDNNQTQDLIITGQNANGQFVTNLYNNDGSGNFTTVANTSFNSLEYSKIEVADTDNDGDMDILMIGQAGNNNYQVHLYANDGNGNFSEVTGTGLVGTTSGTLDLVDFDKDGDPDVLITGLNTTGVIGVVYENQGNNSFVLGQSLIDIYESNTVVGDIDNDNDIDALIVGTPSVGGNNNSPGSAFRPRIYFNETIVVNTNAVELSIDAFLYPNPTNGMVYFQSDANLPSSIRVFDALGKLVYTSENLTNNSQIWLNQPAGLYMVVIETEKIRNTQKLIIVK